MKRITRRILGVVFIILGLAALLTPLTPGSWLIVVGLEFLGLWTLLADRLLAWAEARPTNRFARLICRLLHARMRKSHERRKWRDKCKP